MPQFIAPELLTVARIVALKFAARARIDRDDAVGWAYLAVAELHAKKPLSSPDDDGLVVVCVKHKLIDWQRRESLLSRGERDRKDVRRQRVEVEEADRVEMLDAPVSEPRLRDALEALPPKEQEAVAAVYFDGIAAAEHARRTFYTESRISQFLQSALKRLRQFFHEE